MESLPSLGDAAVAVYEDLPYAAWYADRRSCSTWRGSPLSRMEIMETWDPTILIGLYPSQIDDEWVHVTRKYLRRGAGSDGCSRQSIWIRSDATEVNTVKALLS